MSAYLPVAALAFGILSATASIASAQPPVSQESLTTTYSEREPFYHVAEDNAYIGTFQSEPNTCVVSVSFEPASPKGDEQPRQVKFELRASDTFAFMVNKAGASLKFHCAPDAKSLAISQSWTPAASLGAMR